MSEARTRDDAVASGRGEERRWIPSLHAVLVALLLGAGGGAIAALWLTISEVTGFGAVVGS